MRGGMGGAGRCRHWPIWPCSAGPCSRPWLRRRGCLSSTWFCGRSAVRWHGERGRTWTPRAWRHGAITDGACAAVPRARDHSNTRGGQAPTADERALLVSLSDARKRMAECLPACVCVRACLCVCVYVSVWDDDSAPWLAYGLTEGGGLQRSWTRTGP
jgi:hypothetical protein